MKQLLTILSLLIGFAFCTATNTHAQTKEGSASYYHNKFNGRKTATGEIFSNSGFTAASNFFPLNSYVKVTNKKNGRFIYVKINDRMGHPSRVIDMTETGAILLGYKNSGTTKVLIELVSPEEGKRKILAQKQEQQSKPTHQPKKL